jgi:transcriptional regulator with XRE-family HTH domain
VATDVCIRLDRRIRALRQRRGWTQTYLAVHTGLGRAFISDLENGKKEPCLRSLEILAAGFEISLSQLFARLVNNKEQPGFVPAQFARTLQPDTRFPEVKAEPKILLDRSGQAGKGSLRRPLAHP